ncbi:plasma-membrane choline transporter-domain-containing protein [Dunaliella salina]|uniref:Choline transporter-like protein n=1 Tax=Dunaliella salina TaxID=3046 RepID=A0ABQ7GYC6_DUNSA|nr:plasma-membrane choline transporter-domain-containing protein [Dunaliella salina]|eukprot:KAF5839602.1 plasma-membrane choline transporter-domain-containing protein [Dunaliella salina]
MADVKKNPTRAYDDSGGGVAAPLLGQGLPGQELFNYGPRKWTDTRWLVTYVLFLIISIAGGVFASFHRAPDFFELTSPAHLNDPSSCPAPRSGRELLEDKLAGLGGEGQWKFDALLAHGALSAKILLPAVGASAAFVNDAPAGGVSLLILSGLLGLLFFLWREQVELVTQLLGVAGEALMKNLGLIGVAVGLQLGVLVLVAPIAVGMAMAITNGQVAYNYARDDSKLASAQSVGDGAPACVDEQGRPVMCCLWEVDSWVPLYMSWCALALLWSIFLAFEVKVYTVSGTVAQWYFGPMYPTARPDVPQGGSRALRSLGHALGPSLGSLCLGSAILTLMSLLRQAMQKAREESGRNIFMYIFASLMSFIYAVIEYLTKFATVRMAMTGQRFFDAGRSVVDLLARNAMDTLGVWWLPPLILQIVDAVFVCFALDRDMNACTIVEVHEVVSKLPTVGPVFEQPDGNIAYGNPQRV